MMKESIVFHTFPFSVRKSVLYWVHDNMGKKCALYNLHTGIQVHSDLDTRHTAILYIVYVKMRVYIYVLYICIFIYM